MVIGASDLRRCLHEVKGAKTSRGLTLDLSDIWLVVYTYIHIKQFKSIYVYIYTYLYE